jgi:hypothetical protein
VEAENGGIWHAVLTRLVRKASLIMWGGWIMQIWERHFR